MTRTGLSGAICSSKLSDRKGSSRGYSFFRGMGGGVGEGERFGVSAG